MRWLALTIALATASLGCATPQRTELTAIRGAKRILFLGDSITYAGGYVDALDAYIRVNSPGSRVELINVGLPSETLSGLTERNHAGGAFPRPDLHERLDRALALVKTDLVVACYGMNDGIYHPFDDGRFAKYQEGIRWLRERVAKAKARLWLLTPPPFDPQPVRGDLWPAGRDVYPAGHGFEGYDDVLARCSEWLLGQREAGWNVIDIHSPLNAYLAERRKTEPGFVFAGDGVHLDRIGHMLITREILRAWGAPADRLPAADQPVLPGREDDALDQFLGLVHGRQRVLTDAWLTAIGHMRPGMAQGLPLAQAQPKAAQMEGEIGAMRAELPPMFPGPRTDYHGFDRYDFDVDGTRAIVVTPKALTPGSSRPWIWRAEFFDLRPELDLALLSRGFCLAYIEVGNTFGAPSALAHWDAFYDLLTKRYGLSKKPTLEGLSRGGLYVYNWAARHPNSVSVIYGDNPVCDFKSWPGGKGTGPGSPDDWEKLQRDYGFASEAEALVYKLNPIDNLAPLAKAHVPIIHCAADADEVVPYLENTSILKDRYERLGGTIEVIVKHGFKHHPHGLDDPTPLVEFILRHTKA
ncbi:MAG: SGNH/GDSL hydrolase family protein [Fimbriimonadaceae bacterium]|nr:SGNH/GDSL hydrolase family protein [Chthonomonadaceae bacterium]MCO5297530.1 SGNH/GDSL hydrolase family protein [Fimbriimonadaceae bacterium]